MQVTVNFFCKPSDLRNIDAFTPNAPESVRIVETRVLTPHEFDVLAADFFAHQDWLDGKGGVQGCLMVKAAGRPSLVINPEGYDYARYVAVV